MPLMVRAVTDDRDGLLTFLEKQREALRAAVHGLTEQQAARVPSASDLSLTVLLKHVMRTERRWMVVMVAQRELPGLWPVTDREAEYSVGPGETLAGFLEQYAAAAVETRSIVDGVADLDEPLPIPEAARSVPGAEPFSARWVLLHLIEETARHAGHADIIRESLDGAKAQSLLESLESGTAT